MSMGTIRAGREVGAAHRELRGVLNIFSIVVLLASQIAAAQPVGATFERSAVVAARQLLQNAPAGPPRQTRNVGPSPQGGATAATAPSSPATPPSSPVPTPTPSQTPPTTPKASPPALAGGIKYTTTKGGGGGTNSFGPDICPGTSYVSHVSLYQDDSERLTGIGLRCNDASSTYLLQKTKRWSGNDESSNAESEDGFNSVRGYAGGSQGRDDIVSGLTFASPDNGPSASLGEDVGYYQRSTQPVSFEVPSDSVVVGVGGKYGFYFDSLYFAYREVS